MADVNHLKNNTGKQKVLAIASGRHVVRGHLVRSRHETPHVYVRNALGKGTWEGVEGAWFKGTRIETTDYIFSDGTQTVATSYFLKDKRPHTSTVLFDFRTTVAETDTEANPPDALSGIFKTEIFPDFDADGNQVDPADDSIVVPAADLISGDPLDPSYFTYTVNPARVLIGWMFKYGNTHHSRINWEKWQAWKEYLGTLETVDYRTLPDFPGFGLTAEYYNGDNFDVFVLKRIDPTILFSSSLGSPAIGMNVSDFSVRYEGYLKAPLTGDYDFRIKHDDSAKFWVDSLVTPLIDQPAFGTHEAFDKALTAGVYYDLKLEWADGAGAEPNPAEISLEWKRPGETDYELIPAEYLYPLEEDLPRYEAHVAFSTPTTLDQMIAAVLLVSNSIKQDVNGKLEFYCAEQLEPSFHLQENVPDNERTIMDGSLSFSRTDRRIAEIQNVWEAKFRDLDSQYLEEPLMPVTIKLDEFIEIAGREIYGEPIDLFNMNRWQAFKVLSYFVQKTVVKDLIIDLEATARTFGIVCGDIGQITHSLLGEGEAGTFNVQVIETTDRSPEETAETRILKLQEL